MTGHFNVVFEDDRNVGTHGTDIYARRVKPKARCSPSGDVSNGAGIREMTPAIACISSTSCVNPYRWFNPGDTESDADRIRARVPAY